MTAATSCPWNRILSVTSTACVSYDIVGIHARLCWAIRSPVTTATTPGRASACEASNDRIRAWAIGLRRIAMCSIPGSRMSSMKVPLPRIRRSSSLRLTLWPRPRISSASVAICLPPSARDGGGFGFDGVRSHGPARGLDGLHDVHVARAPANVAGDRPSDVVVRRLVVAFEQRRPDQHHPGGAEPALEAVLLLERRLDRMEASFPGQALDGGHVAAVGLDGEHRAGLHRGSSARDRARAAVRSVASDVGSREAERVAEEMHQQEP